MQGDLEANVGGFIGQPQDAGTTPTVETLNPKPG
jgi:hypothetical protein